MSVTPEVEQRVRAGYARWLRFDGWSDENAGLRLEGPGDGQRIIAADPAGLSAAKPLAQRARSGAYSVLAHKGADGRPRALLLQKTRDRARPIIKVELAARVPIDTATLVVLGAEGAARLLGSARGREAFARIAEAPMGAFHLAVDEGRLVSGYATPVAGDGVYAACWLRGERNYPVALYLDLET